MAISGLHIGIVAGFGVLFGRAVMHLAALFGLRWWALPWLSGLLAAGVYSYLAGFSLPTTRALLMCALAMAGGLLSRKLSLWWLWLAALTLVLIANPLSPLLAGFWLSFTAVAVLIFALGGMRQTGRSISWLPQWVIFIGLLPVLAVVTGELPAWSLPANLLAVPLFSLLIVPINFAAVLMLPIAEPFALGLWTVCELLLGWLDSFLVYLTAVGGSWYLPEDLPLVVAIPALVAVTVLLMPRGWPGKPLAPLLLAPALCWSPAPLPEGEFRLAVMDVGQGLSVLVQTRSHALVYDLGPKFSERFNTAEAVVLPVLQARRAGVLDMLLISHGDNDHAGAASEFLAQQPVGKVLVGEELAGVDDTLLCRKGQHWQWDGVDFEILYPEDAEGEGNNRSCVLSISNGRYGALLPGDIERGVEQRLLPTLRGGLDGEVAVLVAPHHGSATSSTPAFVSALSPMHVVFSAGHKHHFGHPKPAVVARYRDAGSRAWNTARHGFVEFQVTGQGVTVVSAQRRKRRYYWQPGAP